MLKNGNLSVEKFPVGAGRSRLAVLHIRTSDVERMLLKLIESGYASHECSKTSGCFSGKGREQQCVLMTAQFIVW